MAGEMSPYSTLIDLLSARARTDPQRVAFIFLSDGEEHAQITYGGLHRRACAVGGYLQASSAAGERALLLLPSGLDFVVSFFAALYAGMIAVPAYPPSTSRDDGKARRLQSIVTDARPSRVLTTPQLAHKLRSRASLLPDAIELVHGSGVDDSWADRWRPPRIDAESTAFLQYTSGSTAQPKGVMVSHGNILRNERMIQTQFARSAESTVVSWLPPYHDMGLIGGLLQPLYAGSLGVCMSPSAFLRQPIAWLRAISRYRAHSSGGPNFAYDLVVSMTTDEQRRGLDLSTWRVAFNGAEPVRLATIDRFSQAFEPYGFRREAFFPCYGLAEATLIVTGRQGLRMVEGASSGAPGAPARPLVSCGAPVVETQVLIVDPATREPCAAGELGEIWVQGPAVASGYWNQVEETERTFGASLAGTPGRFLRTGDLGCLRDGELIVAGRLKDLIIIRGENYHPEDLELAASDSHAAVRFQPCAAFTADVGGDEALILLHGVDRSGRESLHDAARSVRDAISRHHGLRVHTVVLVDAAVIPRTSSGKVQRHVCRARFQSNAFPALLKSEIGSARAHDESAQTTLDAEPGDGEVAVLESAVRQEVASAMRLDPAQLSADRPLGAWGLDSVAAMEIHHTLLQRFNTDVPATSLLAGMTLTGIVAAVAAEGRARRPAGTGAGSAVTAPAVGTSCVSVEQQRLWLLSQMSPDKAAYNVSAGLPIEGPLDGGLLRQAVQHVVRSHEILGASFRSTLTGPARHVAAPGEVAWSQHAAAAASMDEREQIARTAGLRQAGIPFDLENGPLIRFELLAFGPAAFMLLVCAHHIIMDAESFRILFEQVASAYRSLTSGQPFQPAPAAVDHAAWQPWSATDESTERHLAYWRRQLTDLPEPLDLSHGHSATRESGAVGSVRCSIPGETTDALRELGKKGSSTLFMLLLSGWNAAFHRWTGRDEWCAATPVAGRSRPEARGAIGSFAYPLLLRARVSPDMELQKLVETTRAGLLEAYEHQDVEFSRVVESLRGQSRSPRAPLVQVMFSFIRMPDEPPTRDRVVFRSPRVIRATTDVELFVTLVERPEGVEATVFFHPELAEAAVRQLTDAFGVMLDALVRHPEWTLSDVPLAPALAETPIGRPAALPVCVAASFVADPLKGILEFWSRTLRTPWALTIAPPGQIMQELLDPRGALSRNSAGINLLLLQPHASRLDAAQTLGAVSEFQRRSSSPLIVALCPETGSNGDMAPSWTRTLAGIPGVHVVDPMELLERYPVDTVYDEFGGRVANLPFSDEFYVAAGTVLSRRIRALTAAPYKAIVVDCDRTLWDGVCAEDGPDQVRVAGPHAFLQRFALEQKRSGMLLCLSSKNSEPDVVATFAANPSMPLTLDDFVARRINWRPKSENLRSMAAELGLGLDSFIFLDDNPLECAEVESKCPEVLTLCLQPAADIPRLLAHLWAFDRAPLTAEDLRKTELYRQGAERRAVTHEALTVDEFIAGLELTIDIAPVRAEDVRRVAQLSSRVNQFNVSMRRYSEPELAERVAGRSAECLVARVRDRFGDYGLVGAAVFHETGEALRIEAFLLSCRALGRGVEYSLLNEVGKRAVSRRLARVEIDVRSGPRNTPAQEFITRVGAATPADAHGQATIALDGHLASRVSFSGRAIERPPENAVGASARVGAGAAGDDSSALAHIARRLRSISEIAGELRSSRAGRARRGDEDATHEAVTAGTDVEIALARIWEDLIGVPVADVSQDLFALGGDSLLAVRILGRIRETFQVELSLDDLFLGPLTVRSVASAVETARLSHATPSLS